MFRTDIPVSCASCSIVISAPASAAGGELSRCVLVDAMAECYLRTVTSNEVTLYEVTNDLSHDSGARMKRPLSLAPLGLLFLALPAPAHAADASPPAGGAQIGQVLIATAAASLVTAGLLWFGLGHRSGRVRSLGRLADLMEARTGYPGWVALPSVLVTTSLIVALFGMYWDISLHIGIGRDPGPLANPAHYFILAGLFGIFSAGFIAIVLPKGRPSAVAVKLGPDWYAPLGGVLICACGMFSLIGCPLDDVWHRLFGQDVTLWSPTHLMLIGGAAMALIGISVLAVEGARARAGEPGGPGRERLLPTFARTVASTGGLLLGLSTFQAEFDFGVPQFAFVLEPMMVMLAAGVGLVVARIYAGRGAALGGALFFLALRGGLALAIGPVLGETMPHMPLYLVEALVVEAVAARVGTERPLALGLWSGVGIGTLGLAAEYGWSHLWMPIPWPSVAIAQIAAYGFAMAVAGGLLGAWIGARLSAETGVRRPGLRAAACAAALAISALVVFCLHTPSATGVRADVALHTVRGGDDREASAVVTMHPADAAEGAKWFNVTAWQGGGLVVDPLKAIGPGRYRTTRPIPVSGDWKALIRLHKGSSLTAAPIYLPRDSAIPAPEVPALPSFTRPFVNEHRILLREEKGGGALITAVSYAVVAAIALGLLALLAWALHRLAFPPRAGGPAEAAPRPQRASQPAAAS
jgi:hypothetical protein